MQDVMSLAVETINCDWCVSVFFVSSAGCAIVKAGFHMIADDRESQIVDRRKFCDRLRSCDHMETKVLRSAIETYPIIILILTQMIQRFLATKPECSFMFVTVLSALSSVWKAPSFCLFMNIFRTQNRCFLRF